MEFITVKNLKFKYESEKEILKGLDFTINRGEYVAIIGDSGCGKSTLCHILCGIIPNAVSGILSGTVELDGQHIKEMEFKDFARKIGFVMQDSDRQIVTSTVEDELSFGPENFCLEPEEIRRRVDDTLELLGLSELRDVNPNRLSGGQKQMVTIGSVLTLDPEVFILDEPFSHLDRENRDNLEQVIEALKERGKTILIVEHDHTTVKKADKWLFLQDGKVKICDIPEKVRGYL